MYFALHNNNIRAVLNRESIQSMSGRDVQIFWSRGSVGGSPSTMGKCQPIAREGCKLEPGVEDILASY